MKNKTKSKLITGIFIFCIFAMGILTIILPKSDFSETEKRYLASFPQLSVKSLTSGDFASDFEKYLADHTPFRNIFVSINSYFQLIKGNNGSNGVYFGSDGWLIEKPFNSDNCFETNTDRILSFCKNSNLPCSIAVVPSKGYIYNDKLPKVALKYYDDIYFNKLSEKFGNDITVIDLLNPMSKTKDEKQLFYKTDHHWTSDGAFLAYNVICNSLGLTASPESSFDCEITEGFYGTSYSTSLYTLTKPDSVKVMRNKKTGGKAEVIINDGKPETYGNMFFDEELKKSDKYVTFLNGNHSVVTIKTGNPGGKLLLIKDSFAHCLAPFLAENFSEIIMVDLRYYHKRVSQLLEENDITQIMFVYGMENLAESSDIILK